TEQGIANGDDPVGDRVRSGVDAEFPAARRRTEDHVPRVVEPGAAEAPERAVRIDDGADLAGRHGENTGAATPEGGGAHHRSLIVQRREEAKVPEEAAGVGDGGKARAVARIDPLPSPPQVGPEDHGSPAVDDGKTLEAAEEAARVGDGDDR